MGGMERSLTDSSLFFACGVIEFHGIDPYILRKALDILVKRGTAQIFGANEDERGVKFF